MMGTKNWGNTAVEILKLHRGYGWRYPWSQRGEHLREEGGTIWHTGRTDSPSLVGQWMDIKDGAVTVQSYTSAALRVTLRQGPVGISMAMQDNYDIVLEIRQLLKEIACKVIPEWTHTERSKKSTSNNRASGYRQNTRCIAPPPRLTTTVAMVFHNGRPFSQGIPLLVKQNMHFKPLKQKIMKDTEWDEDIFQSIDWHNFHRVMASLPRTTIPSNTKLAHGLWNINVQNAKYYGESNKCPWYLAHKETIHHLYQCQTEGSKGIRWMALDTLTQHLTKINRPKEIMDAILDG